MNNVTGDLCPGLTPGRFELCGWIRASGAGTVNEVRVIPCHRLLKGDRVTGQCSGQCTVSCCTLNRGYRNPRINVSSPPAALLCQQILPLSRVGSAWTEQRQKSLSISDLLHPSLSSFFSRAMLVHSIVESQEISFSSEIS